jgi:hypothetical protein
MPCANGTRSPSSNAMSLWNWRATCHAMDEHCTHLAVCRICASVRNRTPATAMQASSAVVRVAATLKRTLARRGDAAAWLPAPTRTRPAASRSPPRSAFSRQSRTRRRASRPRTRRAGTASRSRLWTRGSHWTRPSSHARRTSSACLSTTSSTRRCASAPQHTHAARTACTWCSVLTRMSVAQRKCI